MKTMMMITSTWNVYRQSRWLHKFIKTQTSVFKWQPNQSMSEIIVHHFNKLICIFHKHDIYFTVIVLLTSIAFNNVAAPPLQHRHDLSLSTCYWLTQHTPHAVSGHVTDKLSITRTWQRVLRNGETMALNITLQMLKVVGMICKQTLINFLPISYRQEVCQCL